MALQRGVESIIDKLFIFTQNGQVFKKIGKSVRLRQWLTVDMCVHKYFNSYQKR